MPPAPSVRRHKKANHINGIGPRLPVYKMNGKKRYVRKKGGHKMKTPHFNSYSFNFKGELCYHLFALSAANSQPWMRAVSATFENLPFAISPHVSPF